MLPATASSAPAHRDLRGWPWFIALSLLLHLLLMLLGSLLVSERVIVAETSLAPFAVRIETASPVVQTHHAPAPAQEPAALAPLAELPQHSVAPPAAQEPLISAIAAGPQQERELGTSQRLLDTFTGAPGGEASPDDEARLQIESLIRTRFAEHFVYPHMARSQGWQGEVVLSFRIGLDGTLSHIQVVRGSGHALLDQAALDSMRSIVRIEFAPGVVLRHVLELRMPVIYQLAQR